jgi:MFS family permease
MTSEPILTVLNPEPLQSSGRDRRRALMSSFLGSTVEFYDFLLYASAATLVFPQLFFSGLQPAVAVTLSYVTLAAGYLARPVGGLLFGHFGDKVGRKKMLFITMMIMGGVSICIGLLPTVAVIGIAAPIILVTLRVVQGVAIGGEWAGSALLAMEHSTPSSRGFGASVAATGGPAGSVLATSILALFALLPEDQFMSWGWRVPFLLSAALVVIALYLRLRVRESPDFEAAQKLNVVMHSGFPLVRMFREYKGAILTGLMVAIAPLFIQTVLATFALTYAMSHGHARTDALLMLTISYVIHIFTIPMFAALSDKYGRRPVLMLGAVVGVVGIWPTMSLLGGDSILELLLGFILGNCLIQGVTFGPVTAFISEKFPTPVRFTGLAFTYQVGTFLGAGFAPLIAVALLARGGGADTVFISLFFCLLCVLSIIGAFISKETAGRPLAIDKEMVVSPN